MKASIGEAEFEVMAKQTGLPLSAAQKAMLYEVYGMLEDMIARVTTPMPPRISPAATAAPVPLLLPAVKCPVFHGLRAGGAGRSKEGPPSANSCVVNLPNSTVPAAASFSAQAASLSGMLS